MLDHHTEKGAIFSQSGTILGSIKAGLETRRDQFEQTQNTHQNKMPETRVPMTLRDQFLQDPFFKSAWEDMESFRGSFLKDSQSTKMIESSEKREERNEENKEDIQ